MPTPPLDSIPLHDAEGALILFQSRVEQITVDQVHGALASRLHQQGRASAWCRYASTSRAT
ncbi:MAG: hypothetical protein ACRDRW_04970 [Pseudonocardiaceae bacterium]